MRSRGRLLVLAISVPVLAFAVIGGFMGRALAQQESYQFLRIFEDVVTLIVNNYVEEVQVDKVMRGAMHGLADGLDPDSAYLDVNQLKTFERGDVSANGRSGLELTRQYYLRVIAARDGSPAARAGLRPGDYIRAINGESTRDTSVYEGMRLLQGTAGTTVKLAVLRGNAAEPHPVELVLEALPPAPVRGRMLDDSVGYLRIAEFATTTPEQVRRETAALLKAGARQLAVDLRGTASGDLDHGIATARLFVPSGTLAFRQERNKPKEAVAAATGDGSITLPAAVLTDNGTSGPAELFAAALDDNKRASLIGERTLGRAARQTLVPLPDGSALLMSNVFYLTPSDAVINEKGLTPDVAVAQPDIAFGEAPPPADATVERAIAVLRGQ